MLFIKAADVEDAFRIVGSPEHSNTSRTDSGSQLHKDRGKVTLFTRRLEDVTSQFPDIADLAVRSIDDDSCILDCEVLGCREERVAIFRSSPYPRGS
jgi:DNA ligase-1